MNRASEVRVLRHVETQPEALGAAGAHPAGWPRAPPHWDPEDWASSVPPLDTHLGNQCLKDNLSLRGRPFLKTMAVRDLISPSGGVPPEV